MQTDKNSLVDYTKRSWLRSYPNASEMLSNNYNPIPMLEAGTQIIALNTQTKDDNVWLLMSYFTTGRDRSPNNIGYVDKPAYLRRSGPYK